jgi:hypothetical protein
MECFRTSGVSTSDPQSAHGVARPACVHSLRDGGDRPTIEFSDVLLFRFAPTNTVRSFCLEVRTLAVLGVRFLWCTSQMADFAWRDLRAAVVTGVRSKDVHSRLLTVHGLFWAFWAICSARPRAVSNSPLPIFMLRLSSMRSNCKQSGHSGSTVSVLSFFFFFN